MRIFPTKSPEYVLVKVCIFFALKGAIEVDSFRDPRVEKDPWKK